MTRPGFGSGSATDGGSLYQFVEIRVLRSHLGALDGVDDDRGRILRAMAPPSCRNEPVVMVGRDQDELPPTMPRDLHGLTQRPVLKFAKLALKFHRCGFRH